MRRLPWPVLGLAASLLLAAFPRAHADPIPPVAEASNMQIIGHSDLNGAGKGGEGLALRQYPDGQRVLFLAHESAPMCVSVIDVTKPEDPKVIAQLPVEAEFVRCNSLGLSGTTLAVAHQVEKAGQPHAGMDIYDVSRSGASEEAVVFRHLGPAFARRALSVVRRWPVRLSVDRREGLHAAQQGR